jgi:hypothetical protein
MQSHETMIEQQVSSPVLTGPAEVLGLSAAAGQGMVSTGRGIPPKLYRIGEVVDYSGLSRQTIHNYTTMGLLHESRWTRGGHRLYDESVFARLDHITQMKQSQKTMQEIRQYFALSDAQGQ